MANFLIFFLAEEGDKFSDLKDIAEKIIPEDPWAFCVQLVATFFLVIILTFFLVKPVRKFIAQRQAIIQSDLDEAANKNEKASKDVIEAETKLKNAKRISKEMIETAKVTALNEKDRIIEETSKEVSLMKEKAKSDIENERKKMKEELTNEVIDIALSAASKVVEREIKDEDNEKIISSFINKE